MASRQAMSFMEAMILCAALRGVKPRTSRYPVHGGCATRDRFQMAKYHIGIDIGGTFTDCFVTDGARAWSAKAATTPAALEEGLLESLRRAAQAADLDVGDLLGDAAHFALGTTSVTNVLAELRGAR